MGHLSQILGQCRRRSIGVSLARVHPWESRFIELSQSSARGLARGSLSQRRPATLCRWLLAPPPHAEASPARVGHGPSAGGKSGASRFRKHAWGERRRSWPERSSCPPAGGSARPSKTDAEASRPAVRRQAFATARQSAGRCQGRPSANLPPLPRRRSRARQGRRRDAQVCRKRRPLSPT